MNDTQTVVVERAFEEPASFEEIQAREDAHAWCLEQHAVDFERTYFSLDRRDMICLYRAPDAEAVRIAQRTAGMPVTRVWSADGLLAAMGRTVTPVPPPGHTVVIVDRRFPEPVELEAIAAMFAQSSWCFDTNGVSMLESYVPRDRLRTLCVLAAPDAETARRANRTAGLPVARIWPATHHAP